MAPPSPPVALPTNKNPFTTFSDWDPASLNQIRIIISEPDETTGAFTRAQNPKDRHWKSAVSFSFGAFKATSLKISNVDIPFCEKAGYGESYVYACLNSHVGRAIRDAATNAGYILNVDEERVVSTEEQWWKTVNKVSGNFGSVSADGFVTRSLPGIFEKTKKGIMVTAELRFFVKLHTTDMKDKTPQSVMRLGVEAVRLYVKSINRNIQMPLIHPKLPAGVLSGAGASKPVVSRTDVAPDDLLAELEGLGI